MESWGFTSLIIILYFKGVISDGDLPTGAKIVQKCPEANNKIAWEMASKGLGCSFSGKIAPNKTFYHCLPSSTLNEYVEFCGFIAPMSPGNCPVFLYVNTSGQNRAPSYWNCSTFSSGCPTEFYYSRDVYKYPNCLDIDRGQGCFRADTNCMTDLYSTSFSIENSSSYLIFSNYHTTSVTENEIHKINKNDDNKESLLIGLLIFCAIVICGLGAGYIFKMKGFQRRRPFNKEYKYKGTGIEAQSLIESLKERDEAEVEETTIIDMIGSPVTPLLAQIAEEIPKEKIPKLKFLLKSNIRKYEDVNEVRDDQISTLGCFDLISYMDRLYDFDVNIYILMAYLEAIEEVKLLQKCEEFVQNADQPPIYYNRMRGDKECTEVFVKVAMDIKKIKLKDLVNIVKNLRILLCCKQTDIFVRGITEGCVLLRLDVKTTLIETLRKCDFSRMRKHKVFKISIMKECIFYCHNLDHNIHKKEDFAGDLIETMFSCLKRKTEKICKKRRRKQSEMPNLGIRIQGMPSRIKHGKKDDDPTDGFFTDNICSTFRPAVTYFGHFSCKDKHIKREVICMRHETVDPLLDNHYITRLFLKASIYLSTEETINAHENSRFPSIPWTAMTLIMKRRILIMPLRKKHGKNAADPTDRFVTSSICSTVRPAVACLDCVSNKDEHYKREPDCLRHEIMDPLLNNHYRTELRKQERLDETNKEMENLKRQNEKQCDDGGILHKYLEEKKSAKNNKVSLEILGQEKEELESQLNMTKEKLVQTERELTITKEEHKIEKSKLEEAFLRLTAQSNKEKEDQHQQIKKLKDDIWRFENQIVRTTNDWEGMKVENKKMESELTRTKRELEGIKNEKTQLEDHIRRLHGELNMHDTKIMEMNTDLAMKEAEKTNANEENTRLRACLKESDDFRNYLQHYYRILQDQQLELQKETEKSRHMYELLCSNGQRMENMTADLRNYRYLAESRRKSLEERKDCEHGLQRMIDKLTYENEKLVEERDKYHHESFELKDRCQGLTEELEMSRNESRELREHAEAADGTSENRSFSNQGPANGGFQGPGFFAQGHFPNLFTSTPAGPPNVSFQGPGFFTQGTSFSKSRRSYKWM